MMDAKTQTRMAADLGATGWWWAVQRRDGSGNVNRLEAVPWERVIADLLRLGYVPCGNGHVARVVGTIGATGIQPKDGD